MNNELKLLNKNLTDAKQDLEVARMAFHESNSDAAYDSVRACQKEIARIQGLIVDYLLITK
jgi:hypothetical protein